MFRIETSTRRFDKARHDALRSRLRQTNTAASPVLRALRDTPQEREAPLQIWVLTEADPAGPAAEATGAARAAPDGELVAGLDAHTWAHWLHVNLLWVDARHRGTGLGSRLLAQAEQIARERRDCRGSRVSTWDFQAPEFYRRHGYEVVCAIPDYPPGVTEYTLTKPLG